MGHSERWACLGPADRLAEQGRQLFKHQGRHIAVFRTPAGLFACNNRCPHEGYPLIEGSIRDDCRLTCNWHSWTFDLTDGSALVGRDPVRVYPVALRDGAVWADLADPPVEARRARAFGELDEALEDHDYARLARALCRLDKADVPAGAAIRRALDWSAERLEDGISHAHAAAADWLALADRPGLDEAVGDADTARLVPVLEILGHLSWDVRFSRAHPFPAGQAPFEQAAFLDAIERQDEAAAMAQVRGAFAAGLTFADLEAALTTAALSHYLGFGHGLIYLYKVRQLIERMGEDVAPVLTIMLVRYLTVASREDLIPEFRGYADALAAWDPDQRGPLVPEELVGQSVRAALALTLKAAGDTDRLFEVLLTAAALNLVAFDDTVQTRIDQPISHNVGWLDFTHAITFANAVRAQCTRHPQLWPAGLLQMACFIGRNAGFIRRDGDWSAWLPDGGSQWLDAALAGLLNHQERDYIFSAHLLKTLSAIGEECRAARRAHTAPALLAAGHRLMSGPIRRKFPARTALQAARAVALED